MDYQKVLALAEEFNVDVKDIVDNGDNYYQLDGEEYLVLDEDERELKLHDVIQEELWAFTPMFILDICGLVASSDAIKSLGRMLSNECEGANDFVRALIDGTCGIDKFIDMAIDADGAGHYLSVYDGDEIELEDGYFAYRIS